MRSIFIYGLTFTLLIFLASPTATAEPKIIGLADVSSGLILREKPHTGGKKLASISAGQEFVILTVHGPKDTIEGKTENWFKVTFQGKTGWVFGGFVRPSSAPPPGTPVEIDPSGQEKQALPKFSPLVRRERKTLFLKLKNGDEKLLVDNHEELYEKFVRYFFLDYLEKHGYYLVYGALYEGHRYLLISQKNGQEVGTAAKPVFSPDGKRFFAASCDLAAGYQDNGIEVFSCEGGFAQKVFLMLATQWGPVEAAWESNKVIRFTKARQGEKPVKARLAYDEEKDHWTVNEIQ